MQSRKFVPANDADARVPFQGSQSWESRSARTALTGMNLPLESLGLGPFATAIASNETVCLSW
jgi:hypothetical protein